MFIFHEISRVFICIPYSGKVWRVETGEFGELSVICQTKTIQSSSHN